MDNKKRRRLLRIYLVFFIIISAMIGRGITGTAQSAAFSADDQYTEPSLGDPIYVIRDSIFNPSDIVVYGDNLYVMDYMAERPILEFDARTGEFRRYLAGYGKGPNELTSSGPKRFSAGPENLYAMDSDGTFNILPLHNPDPTAAEKFGKPRSFFDMGMNSRKKQLVFRGGFSNRSYLLYTYLLGERQLIALDSLVTMGNNNRFRYLAENPLLNQGPFHLDQTTNTAYVGFSYSSLIMCVDIDNGRVTEITEPEFIPIPEVEVVDNTYNAADATSNVDTYQDFTTDSQYLYAIYSGNEWKLRHFIFNTAHLGDGKIIRVFDLVDYQYIGSIQLPEWSSRIVATNDYLIIYSESPVPRIICYRNPFI